MDNELDELKAQCRDLGIRLRGQQTVEGLKKKIDEATAPESETVNDEPEAVQEEAPAAVKMEEVKLLKNYRPAGTGGPDARGVDNSGLFNRVMAGTIIELPADEAKICVRKRIATRDIEMEVDVVKSWRAQEDG